jgi:hypothetical protein
MKYLLTLILLGCSSHPPKIEKQIVRTILAAPEKGFEYPYHYYLPKSVGSRALDEAHNLEPIRLMVIPYRGTLNEKTYHETFEGSLSYFRQFLQMAERKRVIPISFVIPHQNLSRSHMKAVGKNYRMDLQLIRAVEDLRKRLTDEGTQTYPDFVLYGEGVAAAYAARFTHLHPEKVRAAIIGNPGGYGFSPRRRLGKTPLVFPLGVGDMIHISGRRFQKSEFQKTPILLYWEENHVQDKELFKANFNSAEQELLLKHVGVDPFARWQRTKFFYEKAQCQCEYRTYLDVGESTPKDRMKDVLSFVERVAYQKKVSWKD